MWITDWLRPGGWLARLQTAWGTRELPPELRPDPPSLRTSAVASSSVASPSVAAPPAVPELLARRRFVDAGDCYLAELDAAGCTPSDVSILVTRQAVIIEARRRTVRRLEGNVIRLEATVPVARRRQLALPDPIGLDAHEAVLDDGVLRLRLIKEVMPSWAKALPVRRPSRPT